MPTSKPESTDFQLRRRKAAKLTQFFGVDYKQIIADVLESIEKGVEEDRKRGTLQPEEVEV
jgi:predicted secreted protein